MTLFGTISARKSASSGVAARWTNVCTPRIAPAMSGWLVNVPTTMSARPGVATRSKPRGRLARVCNSLTTALPMRPLEPVIRIKPSFILCLRCHPFMLPSRGACGSPTQRSNRDREPPASHNQRKTGLPLGLHFVTLEASTRKFAPITENQMLSQWKRRLLALGILLVAIIAFPWRSPEVRGGKDNPVKLGAGASFGGKRLLPDDNPWNQDISKEPVDPNSDNLIKSIGLNKPLHPDFGTTYQGAPNGIPYVIVSGDQKKVSVAFRYADESDPGPYPIPADAPIEGGPNG